MQIPYPTMMGGCFVVLGFFLYIASIQRTSPLLLLVLGLLAATFIVNAWEARRSTKNIQFKAPESLSCMEGESISGTWEIFNKTRRVIGHAAVMLPYGDLFQIGAILPGDKIHMTPTLRLEERGVYRFDQLLINCNYPYGLMQCKRKLNLNGEIVVYPKAYHCDAPLAAGYEPMVGGRFRGQNKSSSGDNFSGIREMRPGDPMKLIHWPSTSKGLGMMVKEFDEELAGRVGIIMDRHSIFYQKKIITEAGEIKVKNDLLNWACRASASLMSAALDAGEQVEYVELAGKQALSIPPFADGSVMLESLARIEGSDSIYSKAVFEEAVQSLPKKASLCFVLTDIDEEICTFVNHLSNIDRRSTAVYLPERCQDKAASLSCRVIYYSEHDMGTAES